MTVLARILERAMTFEPSLEMKLRLERNRETFAQYVVRMLSFSCSMCGALPGVPCDEAVATSGSCGVQFHRARAHVARCPVTTRFLGERNW